MKPQGKFYKINSRYISDGIGDGYKQWEMATPLNSSTNVFIESPTGTGKTSFLIDTLLPYAMKMERSIIYICNREALKKQTEKYIIESPYGLTKITTKDKISVFSYPSLNLDIIITTYQASLRLQSFSIKNLFYVVFDEAHFFLEDSLFNVNTYDVFKFLLENYKNQVHIFMSATLKEFSEVYINSYHIFLNYHPQPQLYNAFFKFNYDYYHNTYSPPVYNLILYKDDEFLYDKIKDDVADKWLVFVSSKNEGATVKEIIKMMTNKNCCFLTAKNKKGATWEGLINESFFKEDILIATKVIDNGVNILDDMVKNIVLPFNSRTEFLQMLGRRRITANSPINVYIKLPSVQAINTTLRSYERKLDFWGMVSTSKENRYKKRLVKDFWRLEEYNNLFDYVLYGGNIKFNVNCLSVLKMIQEIELYKFLLDTSANTQAYIDCLTTWLDNRIISISNERINLRDTNLIDYIHENLDQPISDICIFYESFLELYKMFCYNKFLKNDPENKEVYKNAISIRKGKTQRKATINRCLKFLELPFVLNKKDKCWIIERL